MADANWGLIILVIAVLLINIVGLGLFTNRRSKSDKKRIEELEGQLAGTQKELDVYKSQVNEHFMKTSVLFGQMTDSYRAVFSHLAEGSQNLCSSDAALLKASDSGFAALTHEEDKDSVEQSEPESEVEETEAVVEPQESSESAEVASDVEASVNEENQSVIADETGESPAELDQEVILEEALETPVEKELEAFFGESAGESEVADQPVVIEAPLEVEVPEGPEWETNSVDFIQDDTEAVEAEKEEIAAAETDTEKRKEV